MAFSFINFVSVVQNANFSNARHDFTLNPDWIDVWFPAQILGFDYVSGCG